MVLPARRLARLVLAMAVLVGACGGDEPPPISGNRTSTTRAPTTTGELPTTTPPGEVAPTTLGGGDAAPATTAPAEAAVVLTPTGLGSLVVGMSEAEASDTGLIGAIGPGCELSGTRSAPLARGDVEGSAEFADGVLGIITVTGGATTEEGVAVGDSLSALGPAFGANAIVDVDRSPEEAFGIWVATVIRGDGGIYQMVVDPGTETVTSMAVPGVSFCE